MLSDLTNFLLKRFVTCLIKLNDIHCEELLEELHSCKFCLIRTWIHLSKELSQVESSPDSH